MPKRREVPRKACEQYAALMHRSDIPFHEIGRTLQQEWPDVFTPDVTPESVNEACRRWSKRHGVELPPKKRRYVPAAVNRYGQEVPELIIPYSQRVIVISDLHASAHDVRPVEHALKVIEEQEIDTVIFNGDQLDNSYLGHKGVRSRWAAPFEENIEQFAGVANAFYEAGARRFYALQGNHCEKPMRGTDGELTYPQWWDSAIAPSLDYPELFTVTHRFYLIMEPEIPAPWPFPDGYRNFPWRFTHQKEYGRNPLTVAKRLATKYACNVVCGHQHHLAAGWHESGLWRVADAGTFQHREGAAYKVNRDTTHPEWNQGFLTLIDNKVAFHELA